MNLGKTKNKILILVNNKPGIDNSELHRTIGRKSPIYKELNELSKNGYLKKYKDYAYVKGSYSYVYAYKITPKGRKYLESFKEKEVFLDDKITIRSYEKTDAYKMEKSELINEVQNILHELHNETKGWLEGDEVYLLDEEHPVIQKIAKLFGVESEVFKEDVPNPMGMF